MSSSTSTVEITITTPTPPRPTPSSSTHRLLYRGSLSLPDSHLLLDGLTFTGHAGKSPTSLLENPLALALESMRGRPTLRFLGTAKLSEAWVDYTGGVCLDIHPQATLARVYFESIFCLCAISSVDGKTDVGVRVALGDSNGPETTEILIYGQQLPPLPTSSQGHHTPHPAQIQLHVARLTPSPPPTSLSSSLSRTTTTTPRLPRPDDPTPRRVPILFASTTRTKRKFPSDLYGAAVRSASGPSALSSLAPFDERDGDGDRVFKVPSIPVRSKAKINAKGKSREKERGGGATEEEADVFGGKKKRKRKAGAGEDGENGVGEQEKSNRAKIKKQTVKLLSSITTAATNTSRGPETQIQISISKTHPEFKLLFGHVYSGVAFALRTSIKTHVLELSDIDRLVEAHLRLYVPGYGGGVGGEDVSMRTGTGTDNNGVVAGDNTHGLI